MGNNEAKDLDIPILECFFELDNEEQKQYCLKLRNNLNYEKTIKYEIKSVSKIKFSIRIKIKGKNNIVQNVFDNSEQKMSETLQKIYYLFK